MKLSYIRSMDAAREQLRKLAREKTTYIDRRDEAVQAALDAGIPLVEIARELEMTPQGLIKARKKTNQ